MRPDGPFSKSGDLGDGLDSMSFAHGRVNPVSGFEDLLRVRRLVGNQQASIPSQEKVDRLRFLRALVLRVFQAEHAALPAPIRHEMKPDLGIVQPRHVS